MKSRKVLQALDYLLQPDAGVKLLIRRPKTCCQREASDFLFIPGKASQSRSPVAKSERIELRINSIIALLSYKGHILKSTRFTQGET
jgi:hypothetical protein